MALDSVFFGRDNDLIRRGPCSGNLKSGRWIQAHHVRNCHCYWVVVRKGGCEPKRPSKRQARPEPS